MARMSSILYGHKRIPVMSFYGYLFSALAVDVLLSDWLPGSGTAFVLCCRGLYIINGYKTDKMALTNVLTEIGGIFPILADLTNIAFVVASYAINVAETKAPKEEGKEETPSTFRERAAVLGASYISGKTIQGIKERKEGGASGGENRPPVTRSEKLIGTVGVDMTEAQAQRMLEWDRNRQRQKRLEAAQEIQSGSQQVTSDTGIPYQGDKNVDGIIPPDQRSEEKGTTEYRPRVPLFRQQSAYENNPELRKKIE